jgi:hypothetical protein
LGPDHDDDGAVTGALLPLANIGTRDARRPITDASSYDSGDASSPNTTDITSPSLREAKTRDARTTGTTKEKAHPPSMPRRNRLKYGNGLDAFGQDRGTRGLGRASDEIGVSGLVTETKTG